MNLDVNAVLASLVEWAEAELGMRAQSTLDTPGAAQSILGLNCWLSERNALTTVREPGVYEDPAVLNAIFGTSRQA